MNNFIGTYECKADAKGRIMIPVALKNQLAPMLDARFVLKRAVFSNYLELYPMKEWDKVMAKIDKLNRFKKKNIDFIRRFTAGVKVVEVDSNGRLLIPKDLFAWAGLQKEVVLSSGINIIEIWDKEGYEESINDAAVDFADLAEEVMGDDEVDLP